MCYYSYLEVSNHAGTPMQGSQNVLKIGEQREVWATGMVAIGGSTFNSLNFQWPNDVEFSLDHISSQSPWDIHMLGC